MFRATLPLDAALAEAVEINGAKLFSARKLSQQLFRVGVFRVEFQSFLAGVDGFFGVARILINPRKPIVTERRGIELYGFLHGFNRVGEFLLFV